jgi:NAD(P)H dehydrogenase (quinone)
MRERAVDKVKIRRFTAFVILRVHCMSKILVVYDSKTGNTEKMAFAVAEGAKQVSRVKVVVKKVDQARLQDLASADGIIMGSPTYYGQMSAKLKALIDESVKIHGKLEGKVGAAFTSSGGTATGAETTLLSILQAMLVHGMIIQGRFENKHYGAASVGSPSKRSVESCKELGKRVASLAVKLRTKQRGN